MARFCRQDPQLYENLGQKTNAQIKLFAKDLGKNYITSRYPDATPGTPPKEKYTRDIAKKIRDQVQVILDFVQHEREVLIP